MSVSPIMCKPTGMKVTCYPLLFPWPHLGLGSQPRQTYICVPGCMAPAGAHPGTPIFVMCGETLACDGCHTWRLAALKPEQCTWAPTKRHGSPVEAVLWRQYLEGDEQHSWASLRWFTHAPAGVCQVVTETNTLSTVEGSGLPQ